MTTNTWHRGTATEITPGMSVSEQLEAAGLNWRVEKTPLYYKTANYSLQQTPVFAAYRADTGAFFDVYTRREPWQNADIVEAFNRFCDEAELPMTHLGALEEGRMLYAAAKLPEMISPAQAVGDLTQGYLLLEDSHANGHGLRVSIYANRLICTNGMKIPVRVGTQIIAHLGEFNPDRVERILEAARTTLIKEKQQMTELADVSISKAEAAMQLIKAFGDPQLEVDQQPRIVKTALRLFDGGGKGSTELSAYNTAYGLLHSVTEYFNHHAVKRGSVAEQFQSVLSGSRANNMQKFQRQVVGCYLR